MEIACQSHMLALADKDPVYMGSIQAGIDPKLVRIGLPFTRERSGSIDLIWVRFGKRSS